MREILDLSHPIRTACVIAAVVTVLGSMNVFDSDAAPWRVVASSICYGAILGSLCVGLALSGGRPHVRWLWRLSIVPLLGVAGMGIALYQRSETATSWWLLTGSLWFTLIVSVLWALASCIIAALGWCLYIRRRVGGHTTETCREPNA
jgi:hypothetical protein